MTQGFKSIGQMQLFDYQEEGKKPFRRQNTWRAKAKQLEEEAEKKVKRFDLDLIEGRTYHLEVGGDLLIADDDPGKGYLGKLIDWVELYVLCQLGICYERYPYD